MEKERNSGDVLSLYSDEVARNALVELIQTQTDRNRHRLMMEKRDATQLQRLVAVATVIAVLINVWF